MSFNRLKVLLVSLLAVFAVSAVASSSASATCYKVITAGSGGFADPSCLAAGGAKEYAKISSLETEIKTGEWCGKGEEAKTGLFKNNKCTEAEAKGEFLKVKVPSFWICKEGGTEKYENHLCAKKGETGKWSFAPIAAGETFATEDTDDETITFYIFGIPVLSICRTSSTTGKVEPAGSTKVTNTLTECKSFTISKQKKEELKCVVNSPGEPGGTIKFAYDGRLIMGKGIGPEEELKPAVAGKPFFEIETSGAECAIAGTAKIEGATVCSLPEATVGKVEHEMICSSSGSNLMSGGKPASYTTSEKLKLANGWTWGAEP